MWLLWSGRNTIGTPCWGCERRVQQVTVYTALTFCASSIIPTWVCWTSRRPNSFPNTQKKRKATRRTSGRYTAEDMQLTILAALLSWSLSACRIATGSELDREMTHTLTSRHYCYRYKPTTNLIPAPVTEISVHTP